MKVLFDNQCFYFNGIGGISRLFTEIITRFKKENNNIIDYDSRKVINIFNSKRKYNFFKIKGVKRINYEVNKFRNRKYIKDKLLGGNFDFFIPTYYDTYYMNYIGDTKLVVVVHDFICEKYNININESNRKKKLINEAKVVITVSNSTKKELLRLYPEIDEDKVHTVYHGESISKLNGYRVNVKSKFILFVGNRKSYKNFEKMLHEIGAFLSLDNEIELICVGGGRWTETEKSIFKRYNITNKVEQIDASDDELKWLYENAFFYISASSDEGFGIPVIEAMANNCLVILNDIEVYNEITGGFAVFFEIDKKNNLFSVINNLVNLDTNQIIKDAKAFSKRYSWENTSIEIQNILYEYI